VFSYAKPQPHFLPGDAQSTPRQPLKVFVAEFPCDGPNCEAHICVLVPADVALETPTQAVQLTLLVDALREAIFEGIKCPNGHQCRQIQMPVRIKEDPDWQ